MDHRSEDCRWVNFLGCTTSIQKSNCLISFQDNICCDEWVYIACLHHRILSGHILNTHPLPSSSSFLFHHHYLLRLCDSTRIYYDHHHHNCHYYCVIIIIIIALLLVIFLYIVYCFVCSPVNVIFFVCFC
jgi:hypothetical protein